MAVDQSRTQWNPAVKNAAGKVVKKGYLSQYGRPEKRVTGKVKLVTETGGKRAGQTQKYSGGAKVVSKKPAFGVGGSNPSAKKPDSGLTAAQIAARKAAQEKAAKDARTKKLGYQTGRDVPKAGARKRSEAQAKAYVASKPNRGATSGTVSSAISRGKGSSSSASGQSSSGASGLPAKGNFVGHEIRRNSVTYSWNGKKWESKGSSWANKLFPNSTLR